MFKDIGYILNTIFNARGVYLFLEIAAYYLRVFGDTTVLPTLEGLLKNEGPAVQQTAQKAIETLKEPV